MIQMLGCLTPASARPLPRRGPWMRCTRHSWVVSAPLPHKVCSVEQQHFRINWELVGVCSLEIRVWSEGTRDSISTRAQVIQKYTAVRNAVAGRAGLPSSPGKPSMSSLYQPPPLTQGRHLINSDWLMSLEFGLPASVSFISSPDFFFKTGVKYMEVLPV